MNGIQPALTDTSILNDSGFHAPPAANMDLTDSDEEEIPPLENVSPDGDKDSEQVVDQPEIPVTVVDDEEDDEQELEEEPSMSKEERLKLFHEAQELSASGEDDKALEKYFKCLRGVQPETAFPELPKCLRSVAETYYKKEEYERAIHFIQAEKLYYEAALLDTSVLQRLLDESVKKPDHKVVGDKNLQAMRADEYESLSRYCLEKKQTQLALEYAAKAAKLREYTLGEDHPETTRSLDYVTMVYAEVGKQQYAESLEKFDASRTKAETQRASESPPPSSTTPRSSPGQRQPSETVEREIRISLILFSLMIFIACAVLTVISFYTYCKYVDSASCESLSAYIKHHYDWLRFLVHQWVGD